MVDWLSTLLWLIANPEFGWVVVIGYLAFEIRSRYGRISRLDKRLLSAITVVRALARVHDEVDTERVDEYLVENGSEPSDFLVGEDEDVESNRRSTLPRKHPDYYDDGERPRWRNRRHDYSNDSNVEFGGDE